MKLFTILSCIVFTGVTQAAAFTASIPIFCTERGRLEAMLVADGYSKAESFVGDMLGIEDGTFTWFYNARERILVLDNNYSSCAIIRSKGFI